MQIILDIPEEKYDRLMKQMQLDRNFSECKITPLPKGHGRLVDADVYIHEFDQGGWFDVITVNEFNAITPTIIEADREVSE